mgnify:CR=1 FL=1
MINIFYLPHIAWVGWGTASRRYVRMVAGRIIGPIPSPALAITILLCVFLSYHMQRVLHKHGFNMPEEKKMGRRDTPIDEKSVVN